MALTQAGPLKAPNFLARQELAGSTALNYKVVSFNHLPALNNTKIPENTITIPQLRVWKRKGHIMRNTRETIVQKLKKKS